VEGVQAVKVPTSLEPVLTLLKGLLLLSLLLDATPTHAQNIEELKKGVVKITAQVDGKTKVGTGFIVKFDSEIVYIMTAAHVISGDSQPKVQFFSRQELPVRAQVKHAEGGDDETGMALLVVRGKDNVPAGLATLPLATVARVSGGEDIMVIGHPSGAGDWAILKGSIASRQGRYLTVDANIDEGNSGGPIMHSGQVVGLIGGAQRYGKGVTVGTVREYLEGHGVVAEERASPSIAKAPPPSNQPTQSTSTPAREIIGKDGAPMVLIPAGQFMMGSRDGEGTKKERPLHPVTLDAFYMDKFEVTVARYADFVRATNRSKPEYWFAADSSKHRNLPVVGVDWQDAKDYCEWTGKRLPTEAEWEKASRGTDGRTYPWGNEQPTARLSNFGKALTAGVSDERLAQVDSYEAGRSPYGLHHMAGNVSEWTADWYDDQYYSKSPTQNPKGPTSGEYRVVRGGSWYEMPGEGRSASRVTLAPTERLDHNGFRCAQDVPK
jgi:formylglycine-generating enzyme required for sulfatase activity